MQRLHASVHDLRESGLLRHFDNVQPCIAELATGADGRQHLDAQFGQATYKWNKSTLVRNTDERASYIQHGYTWSEREVPLGAYLISK